MNRPDFWENSRWNNPNQPVVGVTWYEAEAFCAWLSAQSGRLYRLPTEVEWERLARGQHGRAYPWGNEWQAGLCNTEEAGIGHTCAVGLFPGGVSPTGAHDCAGNVWEWCRDWTDDSETFKRIKGGSYAWDKEAARLWARYNNFPYLSYYDLGFRVVAPIS